MTEEFKLYRRKAPVEMRPYVPGEILDEYIYVSPRNREKGSPKEGDMIARDGADHDIQWLILKEHFEATFEPVP